MKKKFLIVFVLTLMAISSFAYNLVIKYKDGYEVVMALNTQPVLTFEESNLVVTNEYTSVTIPMTNVDYYSFQDGDDIKQPINRPVYSDGHFVFSGLPKSYPVTVYTIGGETVMRKMSDSQGHVDINLKNFPMGTYIIGTPNNRIKIINK